MDTSAVPYILLGMDLPLFIVWMRMNTHLYCEFVRVMQLAGTIAPC